MNQKLVFDCAGIPIFEAACIAQLTEVGAASALLRCFKSVAPALPNSQFLIPLGIKRQTS